jgi:hypothetical protein
MDFGMKKARGFAPAGLRYDDAAAASCTSVQLAAKAVPLICGYDRLSEFRSP